MKFKDLKALTDEEIETKKEEMAKELMKLRAQVSTGTNPENSGRIKEIRKTLARIKTARRQIQK